MGRKQGEGGSDGKSKSQSSKDGKKRKNLPPCRVCDAPAAGFHYGVNTCEACKGFFHRSLRQHAPYVCEKNETCRIQHGQKKMCQKCRYEKCVSVGMAKDAIKTGRYTTTKHTKDILEIQRIKLKEKLQSKLEGEGVIWKALVKSMVPKGNGKTAEVEQPAESEVDQATGSGGGGVVVAQAGSASSSTGMEVTETPSQSGNCCDENGITVKCLRNLHSCKTYAKLKAKLGLDNYMMVHCITSVSMQAEPLCYEGMSDAALKAKARRFLQGTKAATASLAAVKNEKMPPPSLSLTPSPASTLPSPSSDVSNVNSGGCTGSQLNTCACHTLSPPLSVSPTPSSSFSSQMSPPGLTSPASSAPSSPCSVQRGLGLGQPQQQQQQDLIASTSSQSQGQESVVPPLYRNNSLYLDLSQCDSCGLPLDISGLEDMYSNKEKVIETLMEANSKHMEPHLVRIPKEDMDRMAAEHRELCKLKASMFGTRQRLPDSEYDYIYANTGIDADDRLVRFDHYANVVEETVRAIVKFSKSIPGFTRLPTPVKVHLIKYAVVDVSLLDSYMNISPKYGVAYCCDQIFRCESEIYRDHCPAEPVIKILHYHLDLCSSIQKLELRREEEVIIRAIAIMSPDREVWCPGQAVQVIYEQLHQCLIYLLAKNRPNHPNIYLLYARVVDRLTESRTYVHNMTSVVKRLGLNKYTKLLQDPMMRTLMVGILFDDDEEVEEEEEEEEKEKVTQQGPVVEDQEMNGEEFDLESLVQDDKFGS